MAVDIPSLVMAEESRPLRILLIEDDEFDVAVFRRAFRRSDIPCEIIRCRRAEEALEGMRFAAFDLDLLVTDHKLPGMSGLELCLELIERGDPFALVLMTGGGSEQVAIKALKAGVHDYIVKDSTQEYLELLPLVLPQVAKRHQDYRARRKAERELRYSRDAALEAARVKARLLADDGEAICDALGEIHKALEQLRSSDPDPRQQREIATVDEAASRLASVVEQILEIAALEPQKVEVRKVEFSLRRLVRLALKGLAGTLAERGHSISCRFDPRVGDRVEGDPGRLRQLLNHLLEHAVSKTEEGEIELHVETTGGAEGELRIVVRQFAGEATETDRERWRTAFAPLDRSVARLPAGVGFELAICVHLVQCLDGRIAYHREESGGAFIVELELPPVGDHDPEEKPRSPAQEAEVATTATEAEGVFRESSLEDHPMLRPLQVLIVEANPVVGFVTSRHLEKLGCRFVTVETGRQAIEALTREPFDVLLMGMRDTESKGFETIRRLRQREETQNQPPIPVVALATRPGPEMDEEIRKLGLIPVHRPVGFESLRRALRDVHAAIDSRAEL